MEKRKIVRYTVLGVLAALVIGGIVYKLPYHEELAYEDVPVWFVEDTATRQRIQGFGDSTATIEISYTAQRNFFAPPTYSGTIRIDDRVNEIRPSGWVGDVSVQNLCYSIDRKIGLRNNEALCLDAEILVRQEGPMPLRQESLVMFCKMKNEDVFYLVETLYDDDALNQSTQTTVFVYPAENEQQAGALSATLGQKLAE